MPELSCLFAASTPPLLGALAADPDCRDRLFRFDACEGVAVGARALAVVHLSGTLARPWGEVAPAAWSEVAGVPPVARHHWLADALPPPAAIDRWRALARATGERLGWWWWWERGDDLYADAAWLFEPGVTGELFAARATRLAGPREDDPGWLYDGAQRRPLTGAPFAWVMGALGYEVSRQYFVPAESWHFDWEAHRVR